MELGVGVVCLPGMEKLLEAVSPLLDVVEVEPQAYWYQQPGPAGEGRFANDARALERCRGLASNCLVHSVGYAVGGMEDGDPRQLDALRETFSLLEPPWWSDHLSIIRSEADGAPRQLGFLMPALQDRGAITRIADRIKRLQDRFSIPFAFETGVNYLDAQEGEIPDGQFFAEVAEAADCGILLDLHNIWTNAFNGRQPVEALLSFLPLERVWELHVAEGQLHRGFWLDSHSDLPGPAIMNLAREVVPRLPSLRAINLEIIADQIDRNALTEDDFRKCLEELHSIWALRGRAAEPGRETAEPIAVKETGHSPAEWEKSLIAALDPEQPPDATGSLGKGIEIYRELIALARRGMLVETLPLTMRYLLLSLGEEELQSIFQSFWHLEPPQAFMSDEALRFAAFAKSEVQLDHLGELIEFELGAHRAAMTGEPQLLRFTCNPQEFIASLKAGTLPDFEEMQVEVELTP